MVHQFHDRMLAWVMDDGETSEAFPVTNGVKQGCVLTPTLFSMVFTSMLQDAYSDTEDDIQIKSRTDGGVFNLCWLQAKNKVRLDPIREFLFADECALNASSETLMQDSMNSFSSACDNFGLTISAKKTEVLYLSASMKLYSEPSITMHGVTLKNTEKFVYLGSTINRSVNIDDEIDLRLSKASAAFGHLCAPV